MQYINGCWNVGTLEKKVPNKVLFSLMARPLTPPPPLNGPAIKRRTFFAASLSKLGIVLNFRCVLTIHLKIQNKS